MINLNHPAFYIHWGVILISLPNAIVIGLMVLVFILALLLPFPRASRTSKEQNQ